MEINLVAKYLEAGMLGFFKRKKKEAAAISLNPLKKKVFSLTNSLPVTR